MNESLFQNHSYCYGKPVHIYEVTHQKAKSKGYVSRTFIERLSFQNLNVHSVRAAVNVGQVGKTSATLIYKAFMLQITLKKLIYYL